MDRAKILPFFVAGGGGRQCGTPAERFQRGQRAERRKTHVDFAFLSRHLGADRDVSLSGCTQKKKTVVAAMKVAKRLRTRGRHQTRKTDGRRKEGKETLPTPLSNDEKKREKGTGLVEDAAFRPPPRAGRGAHKRRVAFGRATRDTTLSLQADPNEHLVFRRHKGKKKERYAFCPTGPIRRATARHLGRWPCGSARHHVAPFLFLSRAPTTFFFL